MMLAVILVISAVHLHGSIAVSEPFPFRELRSGSETPLAPPAPKPLPSPCPPGVPMASCSHLPCDKESCPNYPYAKCVNNYCGGCNAKFYQNGKEVTPTCKKTTPVKPRLPSPCKNGVQIVNCFVNPCVVQQCPSLPQAVCVADYCGGCNARFYINDEEVTGMCRRFQPRYLFRRSLYWK